MKLSVLIFFYLISNLLFGQITLISPNYLDTLNYRQIMFEYEQVEGAQSYQIEISTSLDQFEKHIFIKKKIAGLAIRIDSGFNFGNHYYWRAKGFKKNGSILTTSNISNFYIAKSNWSSSLLIKQETKSNNPLKMYNGLIVYDYGVIANKKGEVLWFLPDNDGASRNLNLNPDGTITYNGSNGSFETDLNGKKTWKAPFFLNDTTLIKNYHHDFKKLKNGHFLCVAEKKLSYETDKLFSVIFEIDRKNNLYWKWDEEPIYYKRMDNVLSNHINAIDIDTDRGIVYISNRNLNSINKIRTASDTSYIIKYIGNINNRFFSGQHSLSLLPNKNLLLFNNNTIDKESPNSVSSIQEINQVTSSDTFVNIVWEYKFSFPKMEENKCAKAGDADLLPNGNILITSGANNRVFEVNRKKEIIWECRSFRRDKETDIFTPQSSYRSHYCSSLYPNYFTIQYKSSKNLKLNKEQEVKLIINNNGSDDDEYTVNVTSNNTVIEECSSTIAVAAQKSKEETIKIKTKNMDEIIVNITSKTNPLKTRNIVYRVN
ncbi:MAG: aryl-sulfate sulfotransferase [Bacteroidota bacterium]